MGRLKKATASAVLGAALVSSLGAGASLSSDAPHVAPPEPAPVVEQVEAKAHVVRPGDALWKIARAHGMPLGELIALNPQLSDPDRIAPGDKIWLDPAPARQVEVRPGDSMWRIAERIGVRPAALVEANPQVADPDLIQPGDKLWVPTTRSARASEAKATPSAPVISAAPPTSTPAPSASTPPPEVDPGPSTIGKLWREVRKLTFDLLADQDLERARSFPLSDDLTADVKVEGAFLDHASGRWERMAFERALPEGQDALWLRAAGTATLEGDYARAPVDARGELSVGYSMVRPHVFDEDAPDALALAEDFVANAYRLPFGHEAARRLSQGAQLTFAAKAELDADGKLSFGTVEAGADADYEVEVEREGGDDVLVRYARGAGLEAALEAKDLSAGALEVGVGFELGRQLEHRYRLDLSKPDAQRAYDALMTFRGGRVEALAERPGNGVRLVGEDDEARRAADLRVAHEGEAGTDLTLTAGYARDLDGERVTTRYTGGLDARVAPDGEDGEGRFGLDLERVVEDDERTTRLGARAGYEAPLSERTDLELEASISHEHEIDERWAHETRRGKLAHGGVLGTEIERARGAPIELGFDAEAEVEYELRTPLGEDVLLPLTGEQMRRAPEDTQLTLRGEAELGLEVGRALLDGELDLSAETSATGQLEVVARRLAGEQVRVTVELEGELEAEAGAGYRHTTEGGARYRASFEHETERGADKSASFTLSLDQASHREAYRALLKGDMGPATRLLDMEAPSWVFTASHTRSVELDAAPVEWLDAGLELVRRDVDPQDSRVRWDSDRRAFTEQASAAGHDVRWIEVEGALAPKLSFNGSAPVGGAVSWRHGFSADKTLRYRAFAPSVDGSAPALRPAFTAEQALELPRGAQLELMGRGALGGFSGLGFGTEWGANGFSAALTASADARHEVGRTWELEVQRKLGSEVELSFEKGSDRENVFEVAARAGVEVDSEAVLGLDAAVDQLALLGKVTEALDDVLEERLALELEASWSKKKADSTRLTFRLDLDRPEARRAYEGLMRLDGALAMQALESPGSGVEVVRGQERTEVEAREHLHLDVFGERLYLRDALRSDETIIERFSGGAKRTDRSTYREERENLIGRERDVRWEAVRVRAGDDDVGKGYYRLRYRDEDPLTSSDEVRRLLSLGRDLSAEPVRAPKVRSGARGLAKLFGSWARHGETELEMDVFFTGAGIDRIRGFDQTQALLLYGEVAARREGRGAFGWADAAKSAEAVRLLEAHRELKESPFKDEDSGRRERSVEVAYWRLTGNELWEDDDAYASARAFAEMVGRMHDSPDPAAWNRAFADMGEALGFDFYDAVATMQSMAGDGELLVHQMRMKGDAVDIEMKDEGLLRYPS